MNTALIAGLTVVPPTPPRITPRPLCEGDLAAKAERIVREIAAALPAEPSTPDIEGDAGYALFFDHLARAFPHENDWQSRAARHLDAAQDGLSERPLPPGLYMGFSGIGWVLAHLRPDALGHESLEAVLCKLVARGSTKDYDLIDGLVGYAVYALEAQLYSLLGAVVRRLDDLVRELDDVREWNLGIAHGIPGVIAVLGKACRIPRIAPLARDPLERAVRWLLRQRNPPAVDSAFGFVSRKPVMSRIAWCYGDLGPAVALLEAARATANPTWEKEAIAIGLLAAKRPWDETEILDAGLCHGSAGTAHVFHRLYRATGIELFADTARTHLAHAISMHTPGIGCGGYLIFGATPDRKHDWIADPSFLEGSAGIALALLAAIGTEPPSWDRLLLCDTE